MSLQLFVHNPPGKRFHTIPINSEQMDFGFGFRKFISFNAFEKLFVDDNILDSVVFGFTFHAPKSLS